MFAFMNHLTGSLPFKGATTVRMVICDPDVINEFETEPEANGLDKYDEVWEGVPVVTSLPNNEHQLIAGGIHFVVQTVFGWPSSHQVLPGANVSDRVDDWKSNYRAPDVLVYLDGNPAVNCGTHWCGGPDFLTEILSAGTYEKIPFYDSVNVREMLIISRDPWRLELHQRQNEKLVLAGTSSLDLPNTLSSNVLPLTFRLVAGVDRPRIEIVHPDSGQKWLI
jgi:Uma2 family endonuclease